MYILASTRDAIIRLIQIQKYKYISKPIEMKISRALAFLKVTYASKTWAIKAEARKKLEIT